MNTIKLVLYTATLITSYNTFGMLSLFKSDVSEREAEHRKNNIREKHKSW